MIEDRKDQKTELVKALVDKVQKTPMIYDYVYYRFVKGLDKKHSALAAGYSASVAKNVAHTIEKSKIYDEILELAVPDELLLKKIAEGLRAKKTTFSRTGNKQLADDFSTRHKYIETALKLKGKLKGFEEGTGNTNNTIVIKWGDHKAPDHSINITPKTIEIDGDDNGDT